MSGGAIRFRYVGSAGDDRPHSSSDRGPEGRTVTTGSGSPDCSPATCADKVGEIPNDGLAGCRPLPFAGGSTRADSPKSLKGDPALRPAGNFRFTRDAWKSHSSPCWHAEHLAYDQMQRNGRPPETAHRLEHEGAQVSGGIFTSQRTEADDGMPTTWGCTPSRRDILARRWAISRRRSRTWD